jgi:hypothetical protein
VRTSAERRRKCDQSWSVEWMGGRATELSCAKRMDEAQVRTSAGLLYRIHIRIRIANEEYINSEY